MGPYLGGVLTVAALIGAGAGIKSCVETQNAWYADATLVKICGRTRVFERGGSFWTSDGTRVEKPETVCAKGD